MNLIKYLVVFLLFFSSISFALARPQGGAKIDLKKVNANAQIQQLTEAKVETVKLSTKGGQLRFKHKGRFVQGDMSRTKVYRMVAGKKVEVPRSQWSLYLKPGTPMIVTIQKSQTQGLVVIAIIAILIGLLVPAVQKVRG